MASTGGSPKLPGPPYPPQNIGLGGEPSIIPDVPVCAVFLTLFTIAAAAHMGLFQVNLKRRERKFAFNAATFGFCFTRILATSLRMAWACYPRNVSLGLAAQIFVYAGIPILFFCNLFWAQRIVRAQHPRFGWSKPFSTGLSVLIVLAVLTILALISAIVVQFYIPDAHTQHWTRGVQIYGATFFGITAILPIPIELLSTLIKTYPTIRDRTIDNFGSGSLSSKLLISLLSAFFLSLGAWYRAITSFLDPLPITAPSPWYFSKASFYTFNFTIEICIVLAWLVVRVDQRFIIPDGAQGPYSYANGFIFAGEPGNEKQGVSTRHLTTTSADAPSISHRTSATTLPPPRLSRADSWSTLYQYIARDSIPAPQRCPTPPAPPAAHHAHHISWGTQSPTRVDSAFGETNSGPPSPCPFPSTKLAAMQKPGLAAFAALAPCPPLHGMGFDPRSGRWEIRSVSVYSDRADLRPGSSLVTRSVYPEDHDEEGGMGIAVVDEEADEDDEERKRRRRWGRVKAALVAAEQEQERVCESCGRCATCGRSPRL